MRVPFRHGVISHPYDTLGQQNFLQKNVDKVDLLINSYTSKLNVTFAHKNANYLHTEHHTTLSAWTGPFVSTTDYWLYIDINVRTGLRTFGHTVIEPLVQSNAPINPITDQMWFDTTENVMKLFNGLGWIHVIRCVICFLEQGTVIKSWNKATNFQGTQIGDTSTIEAGYIIFDDSDNVVRKSNHTFLTSVDKLATGVDVVSNIKLESLIFQAQAATNMAAFTVVALTDFGRISPVTTSVNASNMVYGIIQSSVTTGELVDITLSGVIDNLNWNWPKPNDLVYYDEAGQVTLTPRVGITPIGYVIEPTKILLKNFQSEITFSSGGSSGGGSSGGSSSVPQGYPNCSGYVLINTGVVWHSIEQSGVIALDFLQPSGNNVIKFVIEIKSNGEPIFWPGDSGIMSIPNGETQMFEVIYRPSINTISPKFFRTRLFFA